MKLSRGLLSLLTVLVIFAALAAGVGWRLLSDGETGSTPQASQLPDTEGVEVASAAQFAGAQVVEGAEVFRDTLWVPVIADGQAEAYRRSEIATRTEGVVQAVYVRENEYVEAGALLVQLDTVQAARNVAEAEFALTSAEAEYDAGMLDVDPGGIFGVVDDSTRARRERIIRASTGIDARRQDVERAYEELEWTRVRAPFAGRIADLVAVEGAFLPSGGEVLTLLQLDPIKIEVNVGESEIQYMVEGRRASVRLPGFPTEEFTARVESTNPLVDPESRSARVTLVMPNPGHRVRPGMYARVSVEAQAYPDRVLVPREAVVERDRRDVVFIARNVTDDGEAVAEWRYVTTGFRNQTHVEIVPHDDTRMLEPGEIVLVNGHHWLAHDTAVRIVENIRALDVAGGN
jgi:membrane fusion protein, multidrug efflux system